MEYNLETPTATADRRVFTYPNKIMREFTNRAVFNLIDSSPERFDALERAGFRLERKGDIYDNLYVRFGGHYVDIGTSDRIVKGQIKMKTEEVKEWTEDGLRFADGSELKADLVVLATGFHHDFRKSTREILGEVADQVDDYWGMDREGEIRGAFKPAGREYLSLSLFASGRAFMAGRLDVDLLLQILVCTTMAVTCVLADGSQGLSRCRYRQMSWARDCSHIWIRRCRIQTERTTLIPSIQNT